ncbi:MAG: glycosyltransferase [Fervidobacterium sp.]|uniref:glycosyltransferase n=1 Tax=Fervidobacterium sp. TaxID=1871331 RepID=UPI0040495FEF
MRVLLFTYYYPIIANKTRGVFVSKRLEQYRRLGIEYTSVPIAFKDGMFLRMFKKFFKGMEMIPYCVDECCSPVYGSRTLADVLLEKLGFRSVGSERHVRDFYRAILRSFDLRNYDIIHAHGMPYHAPAGTIAKKLADEVGIPYVVTLHGSDVNVHMADKKLRSMYIETLENASKCIFVSRALLERAKSYGYSGNNAVVVPNGFDPKVFKPMDKSEIRNQ